MTKRNSTLAKPALASRVLWDSPNEYQFVSWFTGFLQLYRGLQLV
jgi:hypothetical protein